MKLLKQLSLKSLQSALVLSGLLLCFTACQKDNSVEEAIEIAPETAANFAKSSKVMANALSNLITEDAAWEEAIKERAVRSENGDQVFLYAFAKDMEVNDVSLSQALASYSDLSETYFSKTILKEFPLISIAYNVPVRHLEDPMSLDINTVYFDFQDDDNYLANQEIPYFLDAKETTIAYGEIKKKTQAYFVIKNNERIVLVDQTNGAILNNNSFEQNYLNNDPNFKEFFYSVEALIGTLENVEYRLNAEVGITYAQELEEKGEARCFRNSWPHVRDGSTAVVYEDDREGAFRGGPEIRQRMNRVQGNGSLMPFNAGRNYSNGHEGDELAFQFNAFLLVAGVHGNDYGWAWWEEDGGSGDDRFNGSFSATVPGIGNIGLNYDFAKNKDDNYGNMEVSWCMGAQWIYMGDIRWWGGPTHW